MDAKSSTFPSYMSSNLKVDIVESDDEPNLIIYNLIKEIDFLVEN